MDDMEGATMEIGPHEAETVPEEGGDFPIQDVSGDLQGYEDLEERKESMSAEDSRLMEEQLPAAAAEEEEEAGKAITAEGEEEQAKADVGPSNGEADDAVACSEVEPTSAHTQDENKAYLSTSLYSEPRCSEAGLDFVTPPSLVHNSSCKSGEGFLMEGHGMEQSRGLQEATGDDTDLLETTSPPNMGEIGSAINTQRDNREELSTARLLLNELRREEQLAVELEHAADEASTALEEAEAANSKVLTRVASLLTASVKPISGREYGQFQVPMYLQQDCDIETQITQEGYEAALLQAAKLEEQLDILQKDLQQIMQRKAEQENACQHKVIECKRAFGEFVQQVAKNSFMPKGGKSVSVNQVAKLLQEEQEGMQRVTSLRQQLLEIESKQWMQAAQRSHNCSWQEEDGKSFHMMDFEQLKVENQTLNERLVEKQEEAKKLMTLLTHWREKLAFQEKRNAAAAAELAELDTQLAKQRELSAQLKRERAEYRMQNDRIKCQTDVINSELLSADWEATQEKLRETDAKIGTLRRRHSHLTAFVANSVKRRDRRTTRLTLQASKLLTRHLKTLEIQEETCPEVPNSLFSSTGAA
ncbi:ankyrin repeat-containing protein [Cyclospora cayetanensis]|uniref:Ankyrin repeat-containing protein n=1 Tax=Cyclospora cayetanensis TaxID=88456 RepID=A0A1D3D2C1_9EIME|nr:ankyrin repeat-containing protein [Cyclospora cayetanensis]